MRIRAGIIGAAVAGLALSAHAYVSAYTSMAVPGTHNAWDQITPSMVLQADHVWVCTQIFSSASGEFKFAANGNWDVNWGGNFTLLQLPAVGVGSLSAGGANVGYGGIAPGNYRVTFYEQDATFDLAPVTPAPAPTGIQLVGAFNGYGSMATGILVNTAGTVWETSVRLDPGADFTFRVGTTAGTNDWGALSATEITSMPFADGNPAGAASYSFNGVQGGTFLFTFDVRSNVFDVVQTQADTFSVADVSAHGSFVSGYPPDYNLERISQTAWQSDFTTTNATEFTLGFIGRNEEEAIGRYWGATNSAPIVPPFSGYMRSRTNAAEVTNATITAAPGSYRVTFDWVSGEFTVQQRFTTASGVNYLTNSSFEYLEYSGKPAGWGHYHAASGEEAYFGAHSGARCGVLMAKTIPSEMNLGSFDQTTRILNGLSGETFRVSAAFRTMGTWNPERVRIIVEWFEGTNLIRQSETDVTELRDYWKFYSLDAIVPRASCTAKVLFKYDGIPGDGYLLVDDVEAVIGASRFQNFNGWGHLVSFTNYSPDWAVSSGKTIFNAAETSPTGGVVISKYVEGSGNNKAIEIFNGTGKTNHLGTSQYYLQQYNNGSATPSVSIALTNVLAPGACVLVHRPGTPTNAYPPSVDVLTADTAHVATNALTFNGDDVIVLRRGGTNGPVVDRVGQAAGTNIAGSVWSRAATDRTLHRKPSVFWGLTNHPASAFDLTEWEVRPKDDFADLGIHFFAEDDPNAPYKPTGHSLLLNTNATLTTPNLDGGVGDVEFYARAQGLLSGTPLQLAIETAPRADSATWTLAEILSIPLGTTNFTRYSSFAAQPTHGAMRFRHVGDGTTNRIRLDDVYVGEGYLIKRSENFGAWTNYLSAPIGNYTRSEWSIQNAQIGTNGFYGSVSADVHPASGYVASPVFEDGVGALTYWLSQHRDDLGEVIAVVQVSTNGGTNWFSVATNRLPAAGTNVLKTNFTVSIFMPMESCLRISAMASPSPFVVDNIEIAIPYVSRLLDFNDFSLSSTYKAYVKDGWNLTDVSIVNKLIYTGYSGLLRNGTIVSPYVDEIGPFSFYYAQYGSESTARLKVEISPDASTWTTLSSSLTVATNTALYSYYNTNLSYHYVRISQTTTDKRVYVDQISFSEPAPPPECTVSVALDPAGPTPDQNFRLTAGVLPYYGAEILAVTGAYRIAYGSWISTSLTATAYGSYRTDSLLGPYPAGTRIQYRATVVYAGIGAAPGSTTYTTNWAFSTTNTLYVSDAEKGSVWINEIFYSAYTNEYDFWNDIFFEDHEYIELCGVAGISITNWRVELLFASLSDVSKNGGKAEYATYTIPGGTVLANETNGFGFYVIGDQQLTTNHPIDLVLTNLVPTNVMPNSVVSRDHIHDRSGIIRLIDNYGNVVYSLSYGSFDSSSDPIPSQPAIDNTTSLSLSGTGSRYDDFAWDNTNSLTIGAANTGQILTNQATSLMNAWHTPSDLAQTFLRGTFHHFDPLTPAQSDNLYVHYAYPYGEYPYYETLRGTLYHREQGAATWDAAYKVNDFNGNYDTNGTGFAYFRMGPVTNYTYDRLDTLEYVIEANPNQSGQAPVYLGSDGAGSSTAYETLGEAQLHPFVYTFPIADVIEITKFIRPSNAVIQLETYGNDPLDPIVTFRIRSTTNLLVPTHDWPTIVPQTVARTNEQNYFTLTNPAGTNRFFAVEPLWP